MVDDNATNRRILEEMLLAWGMVPTVAAGAAEAMQLLCEKHRQGEPYRLVLTDVHMPEIDGFAFAEQIKQHAELGSTVVMMLTSGDRSDAMARCEHLGIAAYLLKPIKQSELLDAIELALGIASPSKDALQALAGQQPRRVGPLHVLLAEDSLVNQKLAVAVLETPGTPGYHRQQRQGGPGGPGGGQVRPDPDGRADAGNGRPGSNGRHPRSRKTDRRPRPDHRDDGPCPQRRPSAVPGGRAWTPTSPNRSMSNSSSIR